MINRSNYNGLGALGGVLSDAAAVNAGRANTRYAAQLGWSVRPGNSQNMETDPASPHLAEFIAGWQRNIGISPVDGQLGPQTTRAFISQVNSQTAAGNSIALVLQFAGQRGAVPAAPAAGCSAWSSGAAAANSRFAAQLGWSVRAGASELVGRDISGPGSCPLAAIISDWQSAIGGIAVDGEFGPETLRAFRQEIARGTATGRLIQAVLNLPGAPNVVPPPPPPPPPGPVPPPQPHPAPVPPPPPPHGGGGMVFHGGVRVDPNLLPKKDIDLNLDLLPKPEPKPAPEKSSGGGLWLLLGLGAAAGVVLGVRRKIKRRRRAAPSTALTVIR